MNKVVANLLRFLVALLVQIFICEHIRLFGFISPVFYLFALLLLPIELPLVAQYAIGFCTGLVIDIFTYTLGVNAGACTLIMFIRPYLVKALNGRKMFEGEDKLIPGYKDFKWNLLYVLILTFIHQIYVILVEAWSFNNFGHQVLNILGNTLFTVFVIICVEYIIYPAKRKI